MDQVPVSDAVAHGFWLGETEVTQGQWRAIMGTTPWQGRPSVQEGSLVAATYISWGGGQEFCRRLTQIERSAGRLPAGHVYRLPRGGEWELACRAGSQEAYCYGADSSLLGEYAVCEESRNGEYAHEVRSRKPNAWGFYDMHGNVSELCGGGYTLSREIIARGGSWDLPALLCESAIQWEVLSGAADSVGFRPVLVSNPVEAVKDVASEAEVEEDMESSRRPIVESGPRERISTCIRLTMIQVSPDPDFVMGSPVGEAGRSKDEDQRAAPINRGFWLGETEVTQSQWHAVMGTKPWAGEAYVLEGDEVAATYVSWNDAREFCRRLTERERLAGRVPAGHSYRLPREAEWELACRAGSQAAYCYGADESGLGSYAVFGCDKESEGAHAREVKRWTLPEVPLRLLRKPNAWGFYDMHGNVSEWCEEVYSKFERVSRGGSWYEPASGCRSAVRTRDVSGARRSYLGFRAALAFSSGLESQSPQKPAINTGIGLAMLHVKAAPNFVMGSSDYEPGHDSDEAMRPVSIAREFWLAETEVTQAQWNQLMATTPWTGQPFVQEWAGVAATHVSLEHAQEFCRRLTQSEREAGRLPAGFVYRLPREAEWELACRAGSRAAYCFGWDAGLLGAYAVFDESRSGAFAHAVKTRKPNAWGFYDMHGNVWEWCEDVDRRSGGVGRGGSWGISAQDCRSALRVRFDASYRVEYLGFRPALAASSDK
ncbi:MAG: SUMF1/EgtB/PvdO family nonheme iron enzyme [Planctomycetes bacterium]|nr:SUMF1/EgtB/PvdO family nonheme iron enzyme [Planctomycetota bacterium]